MSSKGTRLRAKFFPIILAAGFCSVTAFAQGPIYSNIPSTLPTDFAASVPYEAWGASEFGGIVQPDLTNGSTITSATVGLINFAYEASYLDYISSNPTLANQTGYYVPLTLTLYNVNADGSVGSVIASDTVDPLINWATDGGSVSWVNFSFDASVTGDFIYGLSFDTQDYGANPTGVNGPYNSLNFALTGVPGNDPYYPTLVGTNPAFDCSIGPPATLPSTNYCDSAYWNTAIAGNTYGTLGVFSQDTGWISSGNGSGMIEFDAGNPTPEPGTFTLIGLGLIGFAWTTGRRVRRFERTQQQIS